MRSRVAGIAFVAFITSALAAALACTDLFHSTSDFVNACQTDGSPVGCDSICVSDENAALHQAETACAWLGACDLPVGQNQFGACVFQAILAYDCNANPNRTVQGESSAIWSCLRTVQSCTDVKYCYAHAVCNGGGAQPTCVTAPDASSSTLRVVCAPDAATGNEPCAAFGQVCVDNGRCSGAPASAESPAPPACTGGQTCNGTILTHCGEGGDGGAESVDCKDFGAGKCAVAGEFAGCVSAHGAACSQAELSSVTCGGDGGDVATGCPGGVTESVDCSALTGPGSCHPGLPSAALGVANVCQGTTCAEGTADQCNGTTLTSCFRGTSFSYNCAGIGASACNLVKTLDGDRAACVR